MSMVAEDYPKIAEEVRLHSQVQLERPTTEALAALCYAYFDTRPTPLAEVNMMDLNNSPFCKTGSPKTPRRVSSPSAAYSCFAA